MAQPGGRVHVEVDSRCDQRLRRAVLRSADVPLGLEPALASGCPHEELRGGGFPWLQILVHPEIWVYEGATMGLTMRAMLNAEKARRLEQLAADGIDLE